MDELEKMCAELAIDGIAVFLNRRTKKGSQLWSCRTSVGMTAYAGTALDALKEAVSLRKKGASVDMSCRDGQQF